MRRWLMMFSTVAGMLMASAALMAQQGQSSAGAKSTSKQPLRSPATMQVADKGFAPRVGTAGVPLAGIRPARSNESPLLDYIPDEVFVVGAIQPAKLINAKVLRDAISKAGADDVVEDLLAQATKEMILNPSKIVEAAFFIDNESLEGIRKGLMESQTRVEFRNNLKQVGLAMHNFYDTYGSFPNSDGFGESKGNLSWRVHLLPYLEATDLYQQFNLDEPWDSENNKRLIAKMPDVFKVQEVDDPGKTSVHFLTGPGLPFGGEEDVTFRNVTDGTSNTIMTVVGGADTAQEWTKPGGLEIDPDAPVKALGNVADTFLIGLMDGSVRYLRADIDPQTFLHAAQHQDGNAVDLPWVNTEPAIPAPGLIVRYAEDFDQKAFVDAVPKSQEPEPIQIEGRPAFRFGRDASLMFVDKRTMLWSDEATLKRMLAKRGKAGTVKE